MLSLNYEVVESFPTVRGADHGTGASSDTAFASIWRGGVGIGVDSEPRRSGGREGSALSAGGAQPISVLLTGKRQSQRLRTESDLAGTPRPLGAVGKCPRSSPA
ncbi:hypothetical protein [Marinactinospora rubrisoli]|uniref:Uncharacterized protein n=1 Tax=Marinactinospora rubrisoli TaxID=2715399 RepID=A0ABW2KCA3_9ACTN